MRGGSVTAIGSAGVTGLCLLSSDQWWIRVVILLASPGHLASDRDCVRHDLQPIVFGLQS